MTMSPEKSLDSALVWFRRDLRSDDHAALYHALRAARKVWCVFVFDREILDALPRADRRVEFIRDSLVGVDAGQRVQDGAIQHKHAPDLPRRAQRVVQRGVVFGAQIAAQPDQCAVDLDR